MTSADIGILIALLLATTLYSVVLEHYRGVVTPDWTWATVVFGVALCHAVTIWRWTLHPEWTAGDALLIADPISFAVGGVPIVLWQIWQANASWRGVATKAARNAEQLRAITSDPADDAAE